MKNLVNSFTILLALFCFPLLSTGKEGNTNAPKGIVAGVRNYTTFTAPVKNTSAEALAKNAGYEQDPETGMLFPIAPCKDCYELIGKRTEISKTYIKEGSNGRDILQQTSTDAMHYKDEAGRWITIKTQLEPGTNNGTYSADHQPVPTCINTMGKFTTLGKTGEQIQFNNNIELIYAKPDGTELSLGNADWTNYTAGDDGVYVTNAWPGINMEMYVVRGAIKTNFFINHAMPEFADGKLLLRDHLLLEKGLSLHAGGGTKFSGNIEIHNGDGANVYFISAATACEQENARGTLQMLDYYINGNTLDIAVPGNFLNRVPAAYPVIIDPLVTTATISAVSGSTYSPTMTVGCIYSNLATVPANVTVTDVQWSFNYIASGGAWLDNGGADYTLGTCRSPGVPGFFWFCNLTGGGTCIGSNISIYSDIAACIPPPQCPSYPLNITMKFYQNYASTTPCSATYITAGTPLTITVSGRTVETSPVTSAGGITSLCTGGSVTLSTTPNYGVPPYSFSWSPGAVPGNPVTLFPLTTTNYVVTVTDACGVTASANQLITINPIAPITGANIICIGTSTTLTNASGAGTWSSSNPSVATIGVSTGIVNGIAAGTSVITFKTPAGCFATAVITVVSLPSPITGTLFACVGASTALSSASTGGTWTSTPTSAATIGSSSGIVMGVSAGTASITYSTLVGCRTTTTVTINPLPHISGTTIINPTGCGGSDGKIILNGLNPGVAYTVYYLSGTLFTTIQVANTTGHITISGLPAGTYSNISVISPLGCISNTVGPLILTDAPNPPMPTTSNNSPLCEGTILNLTASSAPGVSYYWLGPGGFVSTLQNPVISPVTPAAAGTYTVIATLLGCVSAPANTIVVVNPTPHITSITGTNPLTCQGNEGTITLSGLQPGVSYALTYFASGTPQAGTFIADATGNIVLTGLSAGNYTDFYASSFECESNHAGPVLLTDPAPPPAPVVSNSSPICVGLSLLLFGTDAVPGGTYSWKGPNGFTSNEQNPVIANIPYAGQGIYTVTYTVLNCSASGVGSVILYNNVALSNITASTTSIEFGDSIQLDVSGATYYIWTPQDGSLSDDFIHNPVAKPKDSLVEYTVYGLNVYGCKDSAKITLNVRYDEVVIIPNAFTPNGDNLNDVFKIGKMQYKKLIDFTVYDRWGKEMYHNSYDADQGWDGTYNGQKQDMGVYYYSILVETASGKNRLIKGDVTLIR